MIETLPPNSNQWLVTVTILTATFVTDGEGNSIPYEGSRQLPTFVLDGNIQGITGVLHAHKIAQQIVDPFNTLKPIITVERKI